MSHTTPSSGEDVGRPPDRKLQTLATRKLQTRLGNYDSRLGNYPHPATRKLPTSDSETTHPRLGNLKTCLPRLGNYH